MIDVDSDIEDEDFNNPGLKKTKKIICWGVKIFCWTIISIAVAFIIIVLILNTFIGF